jgi:hypothetical protein
VKVPAVAIGPTVRATFAVDCAPDQPSEPDPPDAVQDVALAEVQLNTVDCPAVIVEGVADSEVTVAAGVGATTVTTTDDGWLTPPVPVQVSV